MDSQTLPKVALSVIAAALGVAPVLVELNRTHATNPRWPGHARFHVVWQVISHVFYACLALALLWWPGRYPSPRFHVAALVVAASLAGFLVALLSRKLYGGTLHDENGIRPVRLRVGNRVAEVELNAALVIVGSLVLALAVYAFDAG